MLKKRHICIVMVPANYTNQLQPLDINADKTMKAFLRKIGMLRVFAKK